MSLRREGAGARTPVAESVCPAACRPPALAVRYQYLLVLGDTAWASEDANAQFAIDDPLLECGIGSLPNTTIVIDEASFVTKPRGVDAYADPFLVSCYDTREL